MASGIKTSTTTLLLRIPGRHHWPQGEGAEYFIKSQFAEIAGGTSNSIRLRGVIGLWKYSMASYEIVLRQKDELFAH